MAGRYRFVPHTADLRLQADGASAEQAVAAALDGVLAAVYGFVPDLEPVRWEAWRAMADDDGVALVEVLAEALFRITARGDAVVGWRGEPRRGRLGLVPLPPLLVPEREVKAVTFNDLVWRGPDEDGRWHAAVTLDL